MRYKTILFDLDGTLLDTIEDLSASVNHALRLHDMPELDVGCVMRLVGNGYRRLIELATPGGAESPAFGGVMEAFLAHYTEHSEDRTRPYDGILPMLGQLRAQGCAMAVISNKGDAAVRALNERFFSGLITVAIGEREGVARKPAPDAVLLALTELGSDGKDAVYVGDSEVDILTAKGAGLPCLSVTWGFRTRELLLREGAEHIADTPEEALAWLRGYR